MYWTVPPEKKYKYYGIQYCRNVMLRYSAFCIFVIEYYDKCVQCFNNNNNNNRRLVTLAEHTSDHGRQTNSSTEEKGEQV